MQVSKTKGVVTNIKDKVSKPTGKTYWLLELDKKKPIFYVTEDTPLTGTTGSMKDVKNGDNLEITHEAGSYGNENATEITVMVPVEDVSDTNTEKETKTSTKTDEDKTVVKAKIPTPRPTTPTKDTENYFNVLNAMEGDIAKKGGLSYISWANSWAELKKVYPSSFYVVHENKEGMPYFADKTGAFVKVSVTVCPTPRTFEQSFTHTVHLPVMDNYNKPVKTDALDTFIINKSVQRCLTKAIAMHGFGLYVYRGEDLPKE